MELEKFIEKRPFLYHLTDQKNIQLIIKYGRLFSTNKLIERAGKEEYIPIKRTKRLNHYELEFNGEIYSIRDQQPISEKALKKCLTHDWECADYFEFLNNRVFMWPTLDRLSRHYNRYVSENPTILRFETNSLFEVNQNVKFSRLNSGATRANSYLGGKPPERGNETFILAVDYTNSISSVAEVTFEEECILPETFYLSNSPDGIWKIANL
jgi:hypothetical protein